MEYTATCPSRERERTQQSNYLHTRTHTRRQAGRDTQGTLSTVNSISNTHGPPDDAASMLEVCGYSIFEICIRGHPHPQSVNAYRYRSEPISQEKISRGNYFSEKLQICKDFEKDYLNKNVSVHSLYRGVFRVGANRGPLDSAKNQR